MGGCCLVLWAGKAREQVGTGERLWVHHDTCKWQVAGANCRPAFTGQQHQEPEP